MENYLELHRHAAVRYNLLKEPGIALRLMVAHAIGGSGLWSVRRDPQMAERDSIRSSLSENTAQAAFADEKVEIETLLGMDSNYAGTEPVFTKLLTLSDVEVNRVLGFVMANTLEVGSSFVEALGNKLDVNMADYWKPDDTFFELLRDKAVINGMLSHIGGKKLADANITTTGKIQKGIIRDFIDGANDRKKVSDWLPHYLGFPFKGYTEDGVIGIDQVWKAAKSIFGKK